MKRRKFVAALSLFLLGARGASAKSLKPGQIQRAVDSGEPVLETIKSFLTKGKVYVLELPATPKPIETIIEVEVELARGKKLPKLVAKDGSLINGKKKPFIIKQEGKFNVQYMGDAGWMVI